MKEMRDVDLESRVTGTVRLSLVCRASSTAAGRSLEPNETRNLAVRSFNLLWHGLPTVSYLSTNGLLNLASAPHYFGFVSRHIQKCNGRRVAQHGIVPLLFSWSSLLRECR